MTFLRFFEKWYNHRQLSVKIANKHNTQQNNCVHYEIMKHIFQNCRYISEVLKDINYFSVTLATEIA